MKSIITEYKEEEEEIYPMLKILKTEYSGNYKDLVVLFSNFEEGTVLHSNGHKKVGDHYKNWDDEQFEKFEGQINLSN